MRTRNLTDAHRELLRIIAESAVAQAVAELEHEAAPGREPMPQRSRGNRMKRRNGESANSAGRLAHLKPRPESP